MRKELEAAFGAQSLGGFEPGGVTTGHVEGSAHYAGRAIDVFFRPYDDPENTKDGWALAHWLVANADRLAIATVIYDDHLWSAGALQPRAGARTCPTSRARTPAPRPSSATSTTSTSTSSAASDSPERGSSPRTRTGTSYPVAERRATAAAMRSSVAVSATRTCSAPAAP